MQKASMKIVLILIWLATATSRQTDSHQQAVEEHINSHTIVQLFEWPHLAVARECRSFLGRAGYWAVQISPAQECAVVEGRPWWERYQPVSYRLGSRSGGARRLAAAARVCARHGVRLIADVVLNHMTGGEAGRGTAGTPYNGTAERYHGEPAYTPADFNDNRCSTSDGNIQDYGSAGQVRNCRLSGLRDLDQALPHVSRHMLLYLKRLLALGVTGFRIDAAKHMWPANLEAILGRLKVPARWRHVKGKYGRSRPLWRPLVYLEVIDHGDGREAVHAGEYTRLGRVTEFRHCDHISQLVRRTDHLAYTRTWGPSWAMLDSRDALVFVDNHDNQRAAAGVVTHREPRLYRLAQALVLARPYGLARVMSSYRFSSSDQGPPADSASGRIRPPHVDPASGQCRGGWVCEHRWPVVAAMVALRRAAGTAPLARWWTNGDQQIAYAREQRAFIAVNNERTQPLRQTLNTTLAAGTYCDVISGQSDITHTYCTGTAVTVTADGMASIELNADAKDAVLAIHVHQKLADQ